MCPGHTNVQRLSIVSLITPQLVYVRFTEVETINTHTHTSCTHDGLCMACKLII